MTLMKRQSNRQIRKPLPVEHVEVSHKHMGLRLGFFIFFLILAIVGIGLGTYFAVRQESGWQLVKPRDSAKTNCSDEFNFYYYLDGKASANKTESKAVQNKYTELTVTVYQLFTPYEEIAGVHNVYYINHHYNEEIEVDSVLYNAFEKVASSRFIFGAPVQTARDSLLSNANLEDWQVAEYDPAKSDSALADCLELLSFTNDENHVRIELLGNNKIVLRVSDEYRNFIVANEIDYIIDFSYWKNAFIIDYMASELIGAGFSKGFLVSYDGYTRTLSDQNCSFYIFSKIDGSISYTAIAQLSGNFSSISLRSFGIGGMSDNLHYKYADGTYLHCYFDMTDALSKCSTDSLVVYSKTKKCTDILQGVYTIWIADSFDKAALTALKANGAEYVYARDSTVHYSDESLVVLLAENTDNITYSAIKD